MTSGPIETLSWVVAKVLRLFCFLLLLSFFHSAWHYIRLSGWGKSRSFFQGLVLRKPTFSIQNLHFTDLFDPLADCTTKEASRWSLRLKVPQNSRGAGRSFHAFELGGEKVEIDSSADGKLEIDALLFFSEHLCSRNTRKINAGRPKQKANPPSSTVFDGLPLLFSFLRTHGWFRSHARGPMASSGRLFDRVGRRMDCVCAWMIVSLNSDRARNLSGLLFLCFHVLFLACVYTESFLFGFSVV